MKIVIDAAFGKRHHAGLEIFNLYLLKNIAKIDCQNQYLILGYFWRDFEERKRLVSIPSQSNFTVYLKRRPKRLVHFLENRRFGLIERWLCKENVDLFHGVNYFLPALKKIKGIITIYDLSFLVDPSWYYDRWFQHLPLYLQRAKKVITISKNTADDLFKYYGKYMEKTTVIYPGIDKEVFRVIEEKEVFANFRKKNLCQEPFLLTVATSAGRKNLSGVVRAFCQIDRWNPNLKLVIVGRKQELLPAVAEEIRSAGLKDKVVFSGYLSQEELVYLYNRAELFLFPSFYEGFGMPVLEAMACGCPVITSNTSSLPEIAQGAALLVDPRKPQEIFEAAKRLLTDRILRAELRAKGLERADSFSWEKAARETLAVYQDLYQRG